MDTKRQLDTVGTLETQLAQLGRPSEDLNLIDEQIDSHRVSITNHRPTSYPLSYPGTQVSDQTMRKINPFVLSIHLCDLFQEIAGEVADLNTPVTELLAQAQRLLEDNRDAAKRDPGTQQQYQRLRFNTSDLKVRFNNVSVHQLGYLSRMNFKMTAFFCEN